MRKSEVSQSNLNLLKSVWTDIYNTVPITGKSFDSLKVVFDAYADKLTQEIKAHKEAETKKPETK